MTNKELTHIIQQEIKEFFKTNEYSLEDELLLINEVWLGELLNPNDAYDYCGSKGFYRYKDLNDVEFFVRLTYQPTNDPYFELKTGWINDEGKPIYEPSIPPVSPKSSSKDWNTRSNTLAKIFKDELISFFIKQKLTDIIKIKPISKSRMKFSERMVNKFVDNNKFKIIILDKEIHIIKK